MIDRRRANRQGQTLTALMVIRLYGWPTNSFRWPINGIKKVAATDLQLVMMFAAARYAAHVGKNVLAVDEQEKFIDHMTKQYQDMLRTHMADPTV